MECIYCKGTLTRKTAPFSIQRQGYYLDLIGNKTTKMPSKLYTVSVLLIFRAFLKALLYKGFTYFRLSLLHWDAIPAWICEQCGEASFEAHEVDLLQKALADLDRKNAEFKEA